MQWPPAAGLAAFRRTLFAAAPAATLSLGSTNVISETWSPATLELQARKIGGVNQCKKNRATAAKTTATGWFVATPYAAAKAAWTMVGGKGRWWCGGGWNTLARVRYRHTHVKRKLMMKMTQF